MVHYCNNPGIGRRAKHKVNVNQCILFEKDCVLYVNNTKLFNVKARPSTIKYKNKLKYGIEQLANLLKNINKIVGNGHINATEQMAITGKWNGCNFKN